MSKRHNQRNGHTQPLMVQLLSSEGQLFIVPEPVARRSGVISAVLEDVGARDPIPLLNVPTIVLKKVRPLDLKLASLQNLIPNYRYIGTGLL